MVIVGLTLYIKMIPGSQKSDMERKIFTLIDLIENEEGTKIKLDTIRPLDADGDGREDELFLIDRYLMILFE